MSTSSYRASENGSISDKDSVFIERVRSYNPVTKMVQVLDGNSVLPMSPTAHSPSYQPVMWSTEPVQQVQYIQEAQSPTYSQGTLRRYIVQNPEPEPQSPTYSQGTLRRYIVQNPEPEVHSQETIRRYIVQNNEQEVQVPYTQGTIRRYIVQNPEQDVQAPYQHETVRRYIVQNPEQQTFLQGVNYIPSNNVVYEKTIRRVDMQKPEVQVSVGSQLTSSSDQVIEQSSQNVVSVTSTEKEVVSESVTQQKVSTEVQKKSVGDVGPDQLDARYFGELLAELSRKNNDLYNCLVQHVEKIGVRYFVNIYKEIQPQNIKRKLSETETEDIETLIPKGVSELTKQQIRYLLQMRQTSDKSLRLVLATFANLREELIHLQGDLSKLDSDKKSLERDVSFKDGQIKEYETILASLREKNRQQQQELKESALKLRGVEEGILSQRNADSDKDYRLKELEYAKNSLQQENKTLRVQISETCSSPVLQAKTDEVTRHYKEMINSLTEEKNKEILNLRSQITKFQRDVSAKEGSSSDLQMRLLELTSSLEERESLIKRQQEELFRLRQERDGRSVNQTVITERYRTDYPILGLLNDYKNTSSSVKERQTVVVKRSAW